MKVRELVKEIMKEKNIINAELARNLNITPAALWDRLNTKKTKDIPVSTLNEMLCQLDCEIIIRDKFTGKEWRVNE